MLKWDNEKKSKHLKEINCKIKLYKLKEWRPWNHFKYPLSYRLNKYNYYKRGSYIISFFFDLL